MNQGVFSGAVPAPAAESGPIMPNQRPARGRLVRESFNGEYVQRLIDGDPETERHFAAYFGELLRIKLLARVRSVQMVEDLQQETFLRVLTALRQKRSLNSPERLGAFVNAVCNNLMLELYRSKFKAECAGFDHFDPADERASAESALVTEERKHHVRQVLGELSATDRELLRLVFYEDADRAEICRTFGVTPDYLRVLLHRAKSRFRECLLSSMQQPQGAAQPAGQRGRKGWALPVGAPAPVELPGPKASRAQTAGGS